jgi:hypothetical protein
MVPLVLGRGSSSGDGFELLAHPNRIGRLTTSTDGWFDQPLAPSIVAAAVRAEPEPAQ